jgi:ribosomal protein S18 acetylase RimI-like enzyme
MDARVRLAEEATDLAVAGRLLHEFNTAYDEVTPGAEALGRRLGDLRAHGGTEVLLALSDPGDDISDAVGVAVLRHRPAVWTTADEAYLAELWVDPSARGVGLGRALLRACLERARALGCDRLDLGTTEDDVEARTLYESEGLRATEGPGGPTAYFYETEL